MILLGLETSTRACSVAISDGAVPRVQMTVAASARPSDHLHQAITRCLQSAGLTIQAVEGIAVSAGPGSFTGLRVGVTAAKTLAYTLEKPIVPVSSMDVLAANVPAPRWPLWVLVDARKEKVYAARYAVGADGLPAREGPEQLVTLEQLLPQLADEVLLMGDALVRYGPPIREHLGGRGHPLPPELWIPSAASVCRLGAHAFAAGQGAAPHQVTPNYLFSRNSDITGW